MNNTCLYCGELIPEGRLLCPSCELKEKAQDVTVKTILKMTDQQKKAVEEARKATARKIIKSLLSYAGSSQEFTIVNDDFRTLIDCEELFDKLGEIANEYGVDLGEDDET